MSAYADTSFLVSLYVLDANSEKAALRIRKDPVPILLASRGELELTNAISLRVFRRDLSPSQAKAAQTIFRKDIADGILLVRPLTTATLEKAMHISRSRTPQFGTRTLDVLHVAAAVEFQAETFLTFDHNQARLASAEGLSVPKIL